MLSTEELAQELDEWKQLVIGDIEKQLLEDIAILLDAIENKIASRLTGEVVRL